MTMQRGGVKGKLCRQHVAPFFFLCGLCGLCGVLLFSVARPRSVKAQVAFELACPNGTGVAPNGQSFDNVTQKFRQNICIDLSTGVLTINGAGGGTQTIASGTSALGTSAIASAGCATVVTTSATGTATTDNIEADFNADPTAVTGYTPSASGMLTIIKYPTANNVNFKVCNNTGSSITPGGVTLNWRVVR